MCDQSTPTVDLDGIKEPFAISAGIPTVDQLKYDRFTVAGQRQIFTGFPYSMQKMFDDEHIQKVSSRGSNFHRDFGIAVNCCHLITFSK